MKTKKEVRIKPREQFTRKIASEVYADWAKNHLVVLDGDSNSDMINIIIIDRIVKYLHDDLSFYQAYDKMTMMDSSQGQKMFLEQCVDLVKDAIKNIFKSEDATICDKEKCCCKCKYRYPLFKFPFNTDIGKGSVLDQMGEVCIGAGRAVFHNPLLGHTYCEVFEPVEESK